MLSARRLKSSSKAWMTAALLYGVAALAAALAALVDQATGTDVDVLALYFVPIIFAGWRLSRAGAIAIAVLTTLAWLGVRYWTGSRPANPLLWWVNFATQGTGFVVLAVLVSVFGDALRRERTLRRTDLLTGLKTRLALLEEGGAALAVCRRHARPIALAFIDLDNFKHVNDSQGHARGDELLRDCGRVIQTSVRAVDLAARLGGDEFAILLPEVDAGRAAVLMERLRHQLEASAHLKALGVTASIGVVVDATADYTLDELLWQADAQMYAVKHDGKNRVGIQLLSPR